MNEKGLIVIYNTPENGVKVEAKLVDDNVWLTQEQIVKLYQPSKSNISEHIKHILDEDELEEGTTVRKFRIVQFEGGSGGRVFQRARDGTEWSHEILK